MTVRVPLVGETVIFTNSHGHPRAALVTGTKRSLVGEQHVQLIDDELVVHLTAFSPLPRTYHEQHVPHFSEDGDVVRVWAWPTEVEGAL